MTNEEVSNFIDKNEWATGLQRYREGEKKLFFNDLEANAIEVNFPDSPGRLAYFVRVLSLLGAEDESMFYGGLLWITLFGIGSHPIEGTGFSMIDMLRRASGEARPLEAAHGNWFRSGAHEELAAFLVPCIVFGWDAWLVPSRGGLFVYISHDELITVVTRDSQSYEACMKALEHCGPSPASQQTLSLFCPNSKWLQEDMPVQ